MFQTKRKAFDVAEQRKATDGSGKGVEGEGMGGGVGGRTSNNYKPKMPGRGRGARPGANPGAASSTAQKDSGAGAPKKIPKWKL